MRNHNLSRHALASSSLRPGIYRDSDQADSTVTPYVLGLNMSMKLPKKRIKVVLLSKDIGPEGCADCSEAHQPGLMQLLASSTFSGSAPLAGFSIFL